MFQALVKVARAEPFGYYLNPIKKVPLCATEAEAREAAQAYVNETFRGDACAIRSGIQSDIDRDLLPGDFDVEQCIQRELTRLRIRRENFMANLVIEAVRHPPLAKITR